MVMYIHIIKAIILLYRVMIIESKLYYLYNVYVYLYVYEYEYIHIHISVLAHYLTVVVQGRALTPVEYISI